MWCRRGDDSSLEGAAAAGKVSRHRMSSRDRLGLAAFPGPGLKDGLPRADPEDVASFERTPLFSRSRLLPAMYLPVALAAAVILPVTWTCWTVAGVLLLAWLECVLSTLAFVLVHPVRFHAAGRVLMGLVGAMAVALALAPQPDGADVSLGVLVLFGLPSLAYAAFGGLEPHVDPTQAREDEYGRIDVIDGQLVYRDGTPGWTLPLRDLDAVGELTLERLGPDHFVCFVSAGGAKWEGIPSGALGMKEVLRRLEHDLGAALRFGLANRLDFASRVMWPADLAERPLFALGAAQRSWVPFLGGRQIVLAPDVAASLERRSRDGA